MHKTTYKKEFRRLLDEVTKEPDLYAILVEAYEVKGSDSNTSYLEIIGEIVERVSYDLDSDGTNLLERLLALISDNNFLHFTIGADAIICNHTAGIKEGGSITLLKSSYNKAKRLARKERETQ